MKIVTWQSEVAVRLRLNLETLTLVLQPQSAFIDGKLNFRVKVGVLWLKFRTLFMVRVKIGAISGCEVLFNMSTAVPI